jgi:hypothetical protein
MQDPRSYLQEIRDNLAKLQSQGQVTPTVNALFGMIDGLAGLQLVTLERLTRLEQMVNELAANRPTTLPFTEPPAVVTPPPKPQ